MTGTAERDVRDFARQFPTPHVRALLAYCEAGRVTWAAAAALAHRTLAAALADATA